MQPGEKGETAVEGVAPEKELENGRLVVSARPPVGVSHGELVEVGEQRGDPLPNRPLHGRTCLTRRRCHVPQTVQSLGAAEGFELTPPTSKAFLIFQGGLLFM